MVILEVLVFAQMEFLHWAENIPDAMVLSLFSKALGLGISDGDYSVTTVTVTLTTPLPTLFRIPRGSVLLSNVNQEKLWALTEDLIITPGLSTGTAEASALTIGSGTQVVANELDSFQTQFAYVQSVTNPTPSSIGADPDTVSEAQENIKALMSQRSPSSEEDWINITKGFFGQNAVVRVLKDTPNIKIYIKDLTPGPQKDDLEAEALRQRNLLQEVQVLPYNSIGIDVEIRYTDSTPTESSAIEIATNLNDFITDFAANNSNGNSQPIDLYERFASFTGNTNLAGFDVLAYGTDILLWKSPLRGYDFESGQVVRDSLGNYSQGTASTHVIASAFDEAELGLLGFYPVLENFTGGFIGKDYVVKYAGSYYLVLKTETFNIANAQLLPAPTLWAYNTSYAPTDFILEPSIIGAFSYGFIPQSAYTSAQDWTLNLAPLVPQSKTIGGNLNPGDVWYLGSKPQVIYIATTSVTINQAYLQSLTPAEIAPYPKPMGVNHWLKSHGRYRIGLLTRDGNFVITTQDGARLPIPPGIDTTFLASSDFGYGTLFEQGGEVYEFTSGYLSTGVFSSGLPIRRATRLIDEFAFITYPGTVPYFLRIASVKFLRGQANDPEKTVIENGTGGYVIG